MFINGVGGRSGRLSLYSFCCPSLTLLKVAMFISNCLVDGNGTISSVTGVSGVMGVSGDSDLSSSSGCGSFGSGFVGDFPSIPFC